MIYGNIYDPDYRSSMLLKELKIAGEDDDDTNDNPDYTNDDGNDTQDAGNQDQTADTQEEPKNTNDTGDNGGGTLQLGDDNDPNPYYTAGDTEADAPAEGDAPTDGNTDDTGDTGDGLDMATGDDGDNPDYTADNGEGEPDGGDTETPPDRARTRKDRRLSGGRRECVLRPCGRATR